MEPVTPYENVKELSAEQLFELTQQIWGAIRNGIVTGQIDPEEFRAGRPQIEAVADALKMKFFFVPTQTYHDAVKLSGTEKEPVYSSSPGFDIHDPDDNSYGVDNG
jgi:hypothetical protein